VRRREPGVRPRPVQAVRVHVRGRDARPAGRVAVERTVHAGTYLTSQIQSLCDCLLFTTHISSALFADCPEYTTVCPLYKSPNTVHPYSYSPTRRLPFSYTYFPGTSPPSPPDRAHARKTSPNRDVRQHETHVAPPETRAGTASGVSQILTNSLPIVQSKYVIHIKKD
jgi:hypothetical protein